MGVLATALLAATVTSSSASIPTLPPDAMRELAEIEAHDAEHHDPENVYAMGQLRERLGHWNEATALYRSYVRETADGGAHAFEANAAIDRMEHAAGFLKVRADTGYDRRVWLDGRAQAATPPVTLIVQPGKHEVAGSGAAGTIRRVVEVQSRQLVEVWIGPGDPPYPPARPIGCAPCVLGHGENERGSVTVGVAAALLALARRRRTK